MSPSQCIIVSRGMFVGRSSAVRGRCSCGKGELAGAVARLAHALVTRGEHLLRTAGPKIIHYEGKKMCRGI
jgi:hypothetical protein